MDSRDQERIELATKLFEAWSSGDADAPAQYFDPDGMLEDVVAGEEPHKGWPAIRAFFAPATTVMPDLALIPDEFWVNEKGVALTWVMSATITEATAAGYGGEENIGKKLDSKGMTYLEFNEENKVIYEMDYHHGGAATRSLENQK